MLRIAALSAVFVGLLVPRVVFAQTPLDVQNATPRSVGFEIEISPALNVVGQSFGPLRTATWLASGSTGTLRISAATHEAMRSGASWTPVPGSFDPIVIQIDLTTLEATSQPASGALESGNIGLSFTQNALDTSAIVAYIGPDVDPFICTSQAEVDALCPIAPQFCGQVCIPVPGSGYDPATGRLNLVGSETQTACDGGQCFGPFDFFASGGDLRLRELAAAPRKVPALGPPGAWVVALLLLVTGCRARARPGERSRGRDRWIS